MLSFFTLDYFLIFIFLAYLTTFSFRSYRELRSINAFSMGIRSVSTYALASTITATWVSGSGFIMDLTEFYTNGFSYFIASLGMCATLWIVGAWIAPKMERFLGKISVASIMGEEYGKIVRVITAIAGCFAVSAGIFIQFQIMGKVMHYLLPFIPELLCIIISSAIVTFYSFSGGVTAVVQTDKLQAVLFVLALVIAIVLIKTNLKFDSSVRDINLGQQFTFSHFKTFDAERWLNLFLLFAYFLIPGMSPDVVQRISMGIVIKQVQDAYKYSALILVLVLGVSCYISYLLFQLNPTIPKQELLSFFLDLFIIDGTKAIVVIGILSMCMSTADSCLNIAAILVANDIVGLNSQDIYKKLCNARLATILIGVLSLFFAFKKGSLLEFFLFTQCFYGPIIVIPLFAIIFGYKTTRRCCLITMIATFLFVVLFKVILYPDFNILPIAMALNAVILMSSHYIIEKWELLKCFGITSKLNKSKLNKESSFYYLRTSPYKTKNKKISKRT